MSIIECKFDIQRDEFQLNVEFTVPSNGVTAIFGSSGAGKTSILRAIAGLDNHLGSTLRFGGSIWQDQNKFLQSHLRRVGYVFQEASLFHHLTVLENLEYAQRRATQKGSRFSLHEISSMFGISEMLNRRPLNLSGGERQRVALARCLASSPCLMLLDEPLASLDYSSRQEILPLLENLQSDVNIPIIYVSHALDEVVRLADHLILLDEQGIQASGDIEQMLTRLDLPIAYRDEAEVIVNATLVEHDEQFALSYLDFSGGRISVVKKDIDPGRAVRLRIAARDVSIMLTKPTDTSILNCFAATVVEIAKESDSQVLLRLSVGEQILLSRITMKSLSLLKLELGKTVYAQCKSIAVLT